MIELGKINKLEVERLENGEYKLTDGGSEFAFLIEKFADQKYQPGDALEVMVYRDKDGRLMATERMPKAQLGEFAGLKAIHITKSGAFLDWGVPRDLFVPPKEQKFPMEKGKYYIVYITIDEKTGRLMGSSRIEKFLDDQPCPLPEGTEVEMLIEAATELGYRVIINHRWPGLLYGNEVFREVKVGRRLTGYIKQIRDDGKIDVSLEKPGFARMDDIQEILIRALEENNGFLPLTDKSAPEIIHETLGISKKAFKMAVGILYRQKKILLQKDGIVKTE